MKKIFTSIMLLLAIAAGMSLVSCNKQKGEKKYSAKESANKIDATGEAFVNEFNLEKWQATADLVMPAINFIDTSDVDIDPVIVEEVNTVNVVDKIWIQTETVNMENCKGHYVIDANNKVTEEEGNFNDFKVSFSAGGHDYVADITFTNSDNRILLLSYESNTSYYHDDKTDKDVDCPGTHKKSSTYLILPANMTIEFMADGTKPFTVEGNLSYVGAENPREITDIKDVTINSDLAVKAADYAFNLSKLSLKGGTFDETFTLKRNKKLLLELIVKATGLAILDNESVKSGDGNDDYPYGCDNAKIALDVLGQVQVKGNVKYNDLYNTVLASGVDIDSTNVEEANIILKSLEPYYSLNVYYDKGSFVQASVKAKAFEDSTKVVSVKPVIYFQDGTSEVVPDFFTDKYLGKTIAACDSLSNRITRYIQSMKPAKKDDR